MTREPQNQNQQGSDNSNEVEEIELRVETLRAPSHSYTIATPFSSRHGRIRAARLALSTTALVVLAAIVAGVFALTRGDSGSLGSLSMPLAGSGSTATAIPSATLTPAPTRVAYPTPTLGQGTPAALGPAPASCTPTAPAPRTLPTTFSGAIGASPLWVAGFEGSHATKYVNPFSTQYTRYGWMVGIVFATEPGLTSPVVMRGVRLDDGTPLWMVALEPGQTYTEAAPSVAVILDPQQPGLAGFQNTNFGLSEDWAGWYGAFYIPEAGCYALNASWPGGSWRVTFAVGR